ncbi:unnamed protein product [uncultured bacterium]|nr:unnamed protein product [uncultured bacterium]
MREIETWPSPLVSEWLAFSLLEPMPDSNWQFGMLASVMVNLWSKTRAKPSDFIPVPRERPSGKEMQAKFQAFAAMVNSRNSHIKE